MRTLASAAIAAAMGLMCVSSLVAQDKPPQPIQPIQPGQPAARADVPLQIQIVISRYLNDKRISSLPYTLSMSTTLGKANLRLNSDMPVPTTVTTGDGKGEATSYMHRQVGTNIDVSCMPGSTDRRFILSVAVQESWFRPAGTIEQAAKSLPPVSQNYQSNNTVYVNDGETAQFTAATDRTTGEVIRVEVTARVLK